MQAQLHQIDEQLVAALVKCTRDGLAMAGLKPVPVGVGKLLQCNAPISSIIGFVGHMSGSMFLNTSEATACFLAGRMLGETLTVLDAQTLDGLSEITNIIAGQTKAALSQTQYKFEKISVPSVIVGQNYSISLYKGMTSVSVTFEVPEMPIRPGMLSTFSVNMSLMKI